MGALLMILLVAMLIPFLYMIGRGIITVLCVVMAAVFFPWGIIPALFIYYSLPDVEKPAFMRRKQKPDQGQPQKKG